jgi:hypothetical protein
VPAGVRDGRLFRRWEFMRLPHETVEQLEDEAYVWDLLKPWAGPDDVELVRHKVYNFRSLIASRWRDGRLLIAGDAAHVMPPFMGQGMCAGMRDAWNLAWKLELVLSGVADDRLLDTYQAERMPHVSQITDMAIFLGKIICIPDPDVAAERDRAFLGGDAPPLPPFPKLDHGLLFRPDGVALQPGAGLLSPHVVIEQGGTRARFDDVTEAGSGFVVIARGFDPDASVGPARGALAIAGLRSLRLGAGHAVDVDGRIDAFLDAQGWNAMIIRPDFYVYGGAIGEDELSTLAGALAADLRAHGLHASATTIVEHKENV